MMETCDWASDGPLEPKSRQQLGIVLLPCLGRGPAPVEPVIQLAALVVPSPRFRRQLHIDVLRAHGDQVSDIISLPFFRFVACLEIIYLMITSNGGIALNKYSLSFSPLHLKSRATLLDLTSISPFPRDLSLSTRFVLMGLLPVNR